MTKHDATRREFLVRAAVGAGVVAGSGLVPDANAQNHEQRKEADGPAQPHSNGDEHGAFGIFLAFYLRKIRYGDRCRGKLLERDRFREFAFLQNFHYFFLGQKPLLTAFFN